MLSHILDPDTQVTLLLHARLGSGNGSGHDPLTITEYNRIARALQDIRLRPGDLLEDDHLADVLSTEKLEIESARVKSLLDRGTALALAVESWTNMGLWVLSRSDERYPRVLKEQLGAKSPPLLFGAGDYRLLNNGGLVVVGSRDVDAAGLDFTNRLSRMCARQQIQVISGAARGVDKESMQGALSEGGMAIGVTAGALRQAVLSRDFRPHIANETLTLISPHHPESRFTAGVAMGRNKIVYALGTWAVVVSSSANEGGTWAGANENMKSGWIPTFVRSGVSVPEGNVLLIKRGAFPLKESAIEEGINVSDLLEEIGHRKEVQLQREPHQPDTHVVEPPGNVLLAGIAEEDLIHAVWPHIEATLTAERSVKELCEQLNVRQSQMNDWLKIAEGQGLVERRTNPVRYIRKLSPTANGQMTFLSD